ncbi:MAG: hypothetical protein QM484_01985, partial [Woeseiaceae bacterium]
SSLSFVSQYKKGVHRASIRPMESGGLREGKFCQKAQIGAGKGGIKLFLPNSENKIWAKGIPDVIFVLAIVNSLRVGCGQQVIGAQYTFSLRLSF